MCDTTKKYFFLANWLLRNVSALAEYHGTGLTSELGNGGECCRLRSELNPPS